MAFWSSVHSFIEEKKKDLNLHGAMTVALDFCNRRSTSPMREHSKSQNPVNEKCSHAICDYLQLLT